MQFERTSIDKTGVMGQFLAGCGERNIEKVCIGHFESLASFNCKG